MLSYMQSKFILESSISQRDLQKQMVVVVEGECMMYHQCHCSWCGFFTVQFLLRHLVRLFEGTAVSSNNGGNWRDSDGEKIPLEIKIDRRV